MTFGAVSQLAKRHFILGTVLAICSFAQLNDIFHWVNITSWLLMLVTILFGLGLTLIFKGTNLSRYGNSAFSYYNNQTSFENNKMVKHLNKGMSKAFGSFSRYINDNHFSNDSVDVLFGSATVYFDGAEIEGEQATYTVDAVFSSVTIYLPRHWRVEVVGIIFSARLIKLLQHQKRKKSWLSLLIWSFQVWRFITFRPFIEQNRRPVFCSFLNS